MLLLPWIWLVNCCLLILRSPLKKERHYQHNRGSRYSLRVPALDTHLLHYTKLHNIATTKVASLIDTFVELIPLCRDAVNSTFTAGFSVALITYSVSLYHCVYVYVRTHTI